MMRSPERHLVVSGCAEGHGPRGGLIPRSSCANFMWTTSKVHSRGTGEEVLRITWRTS